jgi:hypothetical protein
MSLTIEQIPLHKRRWFKMTLLLALGICVVTVCCLALFWPFRRDAIIKSLEDESLSKVTAGTFRRIYFPHPGCVLEHVVFQHNPNVGALPLISIERVVIEASFTGMFTRHVKRVEVQGMHVLIPPLGSEHFERFKRSSVVIDDLVADGAILEVARATGNPPLKFSFQGFTISDVGSYGAASFKATLLNPEPPGEITTTGKFGPWNAENVGSTPVAGEYYFQHADLGVFPGIDGTLSSSGKYQGKLERIEVDGSTDTPLFKVLSSSHQVQLKTQFHAVVNGENGDTLLQDVDAQFRQTSILARGTVAGEAGRSGKSAALELSSKDGRIQDLLLLFIKSPRAPMSGNAIFKAKISIPPGDKPFLEKVVLQGDFGIDDGSFTKPQTQQGVNSLSQGARADKNHTTEDQTEPQNILSDLKGYVLLKNGIAKFSNLSFGIPGASVQMEGTYNLISEKIDLHGTLKTAAEISKTTHGIKSLLLKVLDPFFKNKPGGYVAPVKISGTYDHPSFGLDIGDRNQKNQDAKMPAPQEKHR